MGLWKETIRSGKQVLFADEEEGVDLEFFSFRLAERVEWSKILRRDRFYISLNMQGRAVVTGDVDELFFEDNTVGYFSLTGGLAAWRLPGIRHEFLLWGFSRDYLKHYCAGDACRLRDVVRTFLSDDKWGKRVAQGMEIHPELLQIAWSLLRPPVPPAARRLWYSSKATELVSSLLYGNGPAAPAIWTTRELNGRERAQQAGRVIVARLAEPLSLEELAAEVGCSPFYLSRLFSQEFGMTIPRYLRHIRIERAVQLLATGRFNVTEAALEVGYSSISHFSKAFAAERGKTPRQFLQKTKERQKMTKERQ